MNLPIKWRRALQLFRLGTELIDKIPAKTDTWPNMLVKMLSIGDAVDKVYGGKSTVYSDIFTRYNLQTKTSEPFRRLFFGTVMEHGFKVTKFEVNDYLCLVEAVMPDGERIFFQEFRYGKPEIGNEFYHTPKFDFAKAMAAMWTSYPHGIYLSVRPQGNGINGNDVTFSAMPAPRAVVVSDKAERDIALAVEDIKARAGEPWCLLAYGPPGVGKTGFCLALAEATGGHLLKIDASAMPHMGIQEIGFLIDAIRPSFLLIDDYDGAPVEAARARALFLFEHLHDAYGDVTVAITVNDPTKLDEALLRSERIDEAKEFTLPDADERRDIVSKLAVLYCLSLEHTAVLHVVQATNGFNHSDIAALMRRFKRQPTDVAIADVQKLRALAAKSAVAKAPVLLECKTASTPDCVGKNPP